jgi:hypothetical protein
MNARAGVVAASYLRLLTEGAMFWEQRNPGFLDEFHASTQMPTDAVVALRRVDIVGQNQRLPAVRRPESGTSSTTLE